VITRDRNHADDSDGVDNGVWDIDPPSAWWRLETNYDHWEPGNAELTPGSLLFVIGALTVCVRGLNSATE
jgi:hypothetical protein